MNQPIIEEEPVFFVKVKLLSNEVFDIQTNPEVLIQTIQMIIGNLKKKIEKKIKVPIEKQRLVYSGKQLLDTMPLGMYGNSSLK